MVDVLDMPNLPDPSAAGINAPAMAAAAGFLPLSVIWDCPMAKPHKELDRSELPSPTTTAGANRIIEGNMSANNPINLGDS